MLRYVLKRFLLLIPVLLVASFMIYGLMALAPGDPGTAILGTDATPEEIKAYNHEVGFDQPFLVRYGRFLGNLLLRGDFGISYRTKQPVMNEILARMPVTATVACLCVITATLVGVPLGVLAAVKQGGLWDTLPTSMAMVIPAIPGFWLGMLLLYVFAFKLDLVPSFGVESPLGYVLPVLANSFAGAARLQRYARSSMVDILQTDYVRTARAKGAKERTVIWQHAMRNGLLPIVTSIAGTLGAFMGGAIVMESLFSLPGLGTLTLTALNMRDTPTVVASALFVSVLFNVIVVLADVVIAFLDPRVKARYSNK